MKALQTRPTEWKRMTDVDVLNIFHRAFEWSLVTRFRPPLYSFVAVRLRHFKRRELIDIRAGYNDETKIRCTNSIAGCA